MASHFYLDDFPQNSEPLSDHHTHVNPAEAFEADDEGYRGQPFPRFGACRGEQWLNRTLRIPRTPEAWRPHPTRWPRRRSSAGLGRWSHYLERAGRAVQEARAIQDIEAFTQGQMAEAEAEGFASAAEAAASNAEAAAAAEAGTAGAGILATAGEAALGVAGAAGAAAGGLAVAGAAAALVGSAYPLRGALTRRAISCSSRAGRAEARTATRAGAAARWTSRP